MKHLLKDLDNAMYVFDQKKIIQKLSQIGGFPMEKSMLKHHKNFNSFLAQNELQHTDESHEYWVKAIFKGVYPKILSKVKLWKN